MALRIGQCAAALMVAAAAVIAVPSAQAAVIVQLGIDINSTSVQARAATGAPEFDGLTHTGTLQFIADGTANLSDVSYDGSTQNPTHVPVAMSLTATINLVGGIVAAGSTVSMTFSNSPSPDNTLTFPLLPGGGQLANQAGFYKLIADMGTSTFANANPIGGVGITPWMGAPEGSFTLQHFLPGAIGSQTPGFYDDVNLEVLVVPEPATVGTVGLAGLALVGRRRRA